MSTSGRSMGPDHPKSSLLQIQYHGRGLCRFELYHRCDHHVFAHAHAVAPSNAI